MDQKKTGEFLKGLRKERELTQEALAEHLGVSGRTVSRWETGSNMPDLDLLIQLADYYEVEIGEILNGERKSGAMEKEVKETAMQIANYTNSEKERLTRRMRVLMIVEAIAFSLYVVMEAFHITDTLYGEAIASFALGLAYGLVCTGVLYTTGCLAKIKAVKMRILSRKEN